MILRINVIASDEERLELLDQNKKAYEKTPEKETAIKKTGSLKKIF